MTVNPTMLWWGQDSRPVPRGRRLRGTGRMGIAGQLGPVGGMRRMSTRDGIHRMTVTPIMLWWGNRFRETASSAEPAKVFKAAFGPGRHSQNDRHPHHAVVGGRFRGTASSTEPAGGFTRPTWPGGGHPPHAHPSTASAR